MQYSDIGYSIGLRVSQKRKCVYIEKSGKTLKNQSLWICESLRNLLHVTLSERLARNFEPIRFRIDFFIFYISCNGSLPSGR